MELSSQYAHTLGDNFKIAYAIGDIHGRYDLLLKSIDAIDKDIKARGLSGDEYIIITLGDYTDRGPDTRKVIEYLMANQDRIISIAGNHEYILLECYSWRTFDPLPWRNIDRELRSFLRNGGVETLESYGFEWSGNSLASVDLTVVPKDHLRWMLDLPLCVLSENHFFVHAGVKPYVPLKEQELNDLIWIRHEFFMAADAKNPYDWGRHIVHGHTPNFTYRAELNHNRTNLDCGGVWSGRQAIGVFDLSINRGPIDMIYVEIPLEDEDDYDDLPFVEKL